MLKSVLLALGFVCLLALPALAADKDVTAYPGWGENCVAFFNEVTTLCRCAEEVGVSPAQCETWPAGVEILIQNIPPDSPAETFAKLESGCVDSLNAARQAAPEWFVGIQAKIAFNECYDEITNVDTHERDSNAGFGSPPPGSVLGRMGTFGGANTETGRVVIRSKPKVEFSNEQVTSGSCDASNVLATVEKKASALRNCYERQLLADESLEGSIVMSWSIQTGEGIASDIRFKEDTVSNEKVTKCIDRVVERMRFDKPDNGPCVVGITLQFNSTKIGTDDNDETLPQDAAMEDADLEQGPCTVDAFMGLIWESPEQSRQRPESVTCERNAAGQAVVWYPSGGAWVPFGGEPWRFEVDYHENSVPRRVQARGDYAPEWLYDAQGRLIETDAGSGTDESMHCTYSPPCAAPPESACDVGRECSSPADYYEDETDDATYAGWAENCVALFDEVATRCNDIGAFSKGAKYSCEDWRQINELNITYKDPSKFDNDQCAAVLEQFRQDAKSWRRSCGAAEAAGCDDGLKCVHSMCLDEQDADDEVRASEAVDRFNGYILWMSEAAEKTGGCGDLTDQINQHLKENGQDIREIGKLVLNYHEASDDQEQALKRAFLSFQTATSSCQEAAMLQIELQRLLREGPEEVVPTEIWLDEYLQQLTARASWANEEVFSEHPLCLGYLPESQSYVCPQVRRSTDPDSSDLAEVALALVSRSGVQSRAIYFVSHAGQDGAEKPKAPALYSVEDAIPELSELTRLESIPSQVLLGNWIEGPVEFRLRNTPGGAVSDDGTTGRSDMATVEVRCQKRRVAITEIHLPQQKSYWVQWGPDGAGVLLIDHYDDLWDSDLEQEWSFVHLSNDVCTMDNGTDNTSGELSAPSAEMEKLLGTKLEPVIGAAELVPGGSCLWEVDDFPRLESAELIDSIADEDRRHIEDICNCSDPNWYRVFRPNTTADKVSKEIRAAVKKRGWKVARDKGAEELEWYVGEKRSSECWFAWAVEAVPNTSDTYYIYIYGAYEDGPDEGNF